MKMLFWAIVWSMAGAQLTEVPSFAQGVWSRIDNVRGIEHDRTSLSVKWVQAPALFSDCRVPASRPDASWFASKTLWRDPEVLQELALQTGFAGATTFAPKLFEPRPLDDVLVGSWPGELTWHHAIADFQDICMDPREAWPQVLNGTHESMDIGAVQILGPRLIHEHGLPVDAPTIQYEEWLNIGGTSVAAVWPPFVGPAMLLVLAETGEFAFAKDKGRSEPPWTGSCSLTDIVQDVLRDRLSFQDAFPYFQTELSFGVVLPAKKGPPLFNVTQSTIPEREGRGLLAVPTLCAALGDALLLSGDSAALADALGCALHPL